MEDQVPETEMYVDGMFAVDCPHCHASWHGTGVVSVADTGEIQTCGKCGKKFKIVSPKKASQS